MEAQDQEEEIVISSGKDQSSIRRIKRGRSGLEKTIQLPNELSAIISYLRAGKFYPVEYHGISLQAVSTYLYKEEDGFHRMYICLMALGHKYNTSLYGKIIIIRPAKKSGTCELISNHSAVFSRIEDAYSNYSERIAFREEGKPKHIPEADAIILAGYYGGSAPVSLLERVVPIYSDDKEEEK